MHIFVKIGGEEKFRGELRKTKLLNICIVFLKNFLARYARSITFYFYLSIRGRGSYTAGTVKSVSLLKVGRKSVNFLSHF